MLGLNVFVKKCVLTSNTETLCANIKVSIRVAINRAIRGGLIFKLLKSWLRGNIVANFSKKCCSNVTNFIMVDYRNSSHATYYCLLVGEGSPQLQDSCMLFRLDL